MIFSGSDRVCFGYQNWIPRTCVACSTIRRGSPRSSVAKTLPTGCALDECLVPRPTGPCAPIRDVFIFKITPPVRRYGSASGSTYSAAPRGDAQSIAACRFVALTSAAFSGSTPKSRMLFIALDLRDHTFDHIGETIAGAIRDLEHRFGGDMLDLTRDARRHIGHRADREDVHSHVARDEDLRDRAHPDSVGAEPAQHAQLRRPFEVGSGDGAVEPADDELACVTGRGAPPEAGDIGVRDPRRVLDVFRETAEAAAENHRDLRSALGLRGDRGDRGIRVERHVPGSLRIFSRNSSTKGRACAVRANRATVAARRTVMRSPARRSCSSWPSSESTDGSSCVSSSSTWSGSNTTALPT